MVTMVQVAKLAGVSTMTVSNVLNDRPSVNAELRRRVLDAVSSSGYVINHAARSLRKGSTGVIGLALPELDRPYSGELAARVVAQSAARGFRVAIEQTGAVVEGELDAISLSRTLECDGLIMTAVGIGPADVQRLGQTIPLVLMGERSFDGVADHVGMDNLDGTRAATAHLIERGCRRVAWIGVDRAGSESDPLGQRLQGYREALDASGLRRIKRLELQLPALTMAAAAAEVQRAAGRGIRFDGLVAVTDTVALGALRGLADAGLRVPDDVRVIGFDDVTEARFSVPSLSTISPDHDWMVAKALDLLTAQMRGESDRRSELVAPYRLELRESSA